MMKQCVAGLISIFFLISACKKDKDAVMPVIVINTPSENQIFTALDTIQITATIEDETALVQIDATVCDYNKVPILATVTIVPDDKEITIQIPYALNDINLESGNYYLWIKAFDGTNTASKYRSIQISAAPRELKYIYIMSIFNSTTVRLQRKAVGGNLENLIDITGDLSATASSSKFQLVAVCGNIYGDLNVYNVPSGALQWSIPVVSDPPFPYFESISIYNEIFYCSFYNGFIKAYNNAGTQVFSANTSTGSFPGVVFANTDYVFADEDFYSGTERFFSVYYSDNGTLRQQISTDYIITNIFQKDEDNIFIFGNQGGQGIIRLYSISANGTWEPHTLPAGMITDVVQIDENDYIISLESGLYKYQYDMNSLTTYLPGVNASKIKYDAVNSDIYAVQGNTINIYDYSSHALISNITASDSIAGFELLYNK
jgi:hypothetical protein